MSPSHTYFQNSEHDVISISPTCDSGGELAVTGNVCG